MSQQPSSGVSLPYKNQTIAGVPAYSSTQLPGYVPTAVKIYGGTAYAPPDNYTWNYRAVNLMAMNIIANPAASGKPYGWDESQLGSWDAIVARNQGKTEMFAGDMMMLWKYMQEYYQPSPGDFFEQQIGAYIPPTGKEYILDPEIATMLTAEENLRKAEELSAAEREFKRYQAEMELQIKRAAQTINTASVQAAIRQFEKNLASAAQSAGFSFAGGGSSGGGGGGSYGSAGSYGYDPELALQQAKLAMDWQIALWQREDNKRSLDLREMELAAEREYRQQLLNLQAKQVEIDRAKINAQVLANPNDRLQMEYMLRGQLAGGGTEPRGNAVNIHTGEQTGTNVTFSQVQEQNAENAGITQGGMQGSDVTVGGFARGTRSGRGPEVYEFVDDPVFVVGEDVKAKDGLGRTAELVINPERARFAVIPRASRLVRKYREGRYAAR